MEKLMEVSVGLLDSRRWYSHMKYPTHFLVVHPLVNVLIDTFGRSLVIGCRLGLLLLLHIIIGPESSSQILVE
jgi:hypothetical protein